MAKSKDINISFSQYLEEKKIDAHAFLDQEPEKYQELKIVFDQVHPNSFELQKKFLINNLRRAFPIKN